MACGPLRHCKTKPLHLVFPWQHQETDNPLIPLLLEIQAQFSTIIRIREGAKKINRQGGLATITLLERVVDAAASLAIGKGVKMATGTTDAVRKAWNEGIPQLTKLSDGQRFHLLFEDAVKNALESLSDEQSQDKNLRMIIFIDDLDRCEESVIVELLESIKLYLISPHCVFVLGVDDTAVLGAMKRHWQTRSEDDNREYLEKMFRATISVPLPRPAKISSTIADQLKAHDRSRFLSQSKGTRNRLEKIADHLKNHEPDDDVVDPFALALERFGYVHAATDWFEEQAESPELMEQRGLHQGEPLPAALGLFDESGRPFKTQIRANWLRLREWLDNDDAILEFFFPQGLPPKDRDLLQQDMALLREQPWSPGAALDAALADWPEDEAERPYTLEHAEAALIEACDVFLESLRSQGKIQI